MTRIKFCAGFFLCFLFCSAVNGQSQDTLPKFSVRNVGKNRVIVGWLNKYELVKQISIQRSFDSLGAYKTISSVADPNALQNGFADTKAPNDHMFYRLFIVLDKGMFFFSAPKRPVFDTTRTATLPVMDKQIDSGTTQKPEHIVRKPDWTPSVSIYTNKDGYVFLNLPDAAQKKYRVKFFDDDGGLLFELKTVKEPALTLDKSNFYHAGWFNFELYNDDKLVEKNKFYLAKMF